jgi:hypothetical protein
MLAPRNYLYSGLTSPATLFACRKGDSIQMIPSKPTERVRDRLFVVAEGLTQHFLGSLQ